MKRNYKSIIHIIIGLYIANIFISCKNSLGNQMEVGKRERYSVNPNVESGQMETSQYSVDSILTLKIPDGVIEMGIDKISIVNSNVYILDNINNKMYTFDSNGNLRAIIGERGHARGEFIGKPDEFFIDSNNKLHVFDKIGHKINVYNEDGSVDKVIEKNEFYPHSLGMTSNDRYLMYFIDGYKDEKNETELPSSLLLFDKKCKDYKRLIPLREEQKCVISEHTFFQDRDRLSFIPCFSDSVIVFKADTIEKIVSFDFEENILCKDMPEKLEQSEDFSFMSDYQAVLGLNRYQETDSFVYLDYIYQQRGLYWLYNKRTGQIICGSKFFEGLNPYSYYCINGNQIIAYIDNKTVEQFKQFYNNNAFQENLKKSPEYLKDLLEGRIQAPVLIYITLK